MHDIAVTIVAAITLGSFVWAVFGHFKSSELPPGAKLVSALALGSGAVMLILVWVLPQPLFSAWTGIPVMLAGKVLFWTAIRETRNAGLLAAFTSENPHGLVRTGPYRFIRHPFYASYLLYWLGFTIATWSIWSLPLLIGLVTMYWHAAAQEEEKFADSEMAALYAEYKRGTGRFLPRLFGQAV